ncbi:MAG TPA: hypothetical protein DD730_04175 [Desulfosporosinus sp.]|nr:hypothetical protein [Desulfosporosinus sp.]
MKALQLLKLTCQRSWVVVILLTLSLLMTPSNAVASEQTLTNLVDLQNDIQLDLTNRETKFTLYYTGDTTQMADNLQTVFEQASQTNDYLKTSLTSWEYKVGGTTKKATLQFTVGYLTTKAQEDYIDAKVKALVPTLISSDMSEIAKEQAIHDWLIKHVAYDSTLNQRTAYTALTTGKTVCTGYAMLMEKMLNQAGIKCYIIAGNLSDPSSKIPNTEKENHVWNLVQINTQWYHVDATNDWNNPDSHMFFNKGSAFMKEKGFAWNEAQLLRPVVTNMTAPSPVKAVDTPIVTKPSETNLQSDTGARIVGFLDNFLTTIALWISSIIQQLSIISRHLL